MPIVLDDNLDPSLYPVAYLVGTWSGDDGAVQLPDGGRRIVQDVSFSPVTLQDGTAALRYECTTFVLDAPAPKPKSPFDDPEAGAEESVDEAPRALLSTETGYWRATGTQPLILTDPGADPNLKETTLEVVLSNPQGYVSALDGAARGPRIELASVHVARTESGTQPRPERRMYGLVNGSLLWVQEHVVDGETTPYLSILLNRA
ncbi:FABP family protein [Micrococcales bacterium 31B]|nr:FABP family protein [Micrococcales bacterium 31B]